MLIVLFTLKSRAFLQRVSVGECNDGSMINRFHNLLLPVSDLKTIF